MLPDKDCRTMFRLRSAQISDIHDLFELSQMLSFINLPADKNFLKKKIKISLNSFAGLNRRLEDNTYIFVLEDMKNKKVIGTSMIHGKHGTEASPHFFFKVSQERKYSTSIHTGFTHGTLTFGFETDGYSEIGGLMLHPDYRNNQQKLGKQLSYVRFLYMALNRDKFTDYIHTELMPPLDAEGHSPLWEAIGRRFVNMEYQDADKLSKKNKEFILSLFPQESIYITLLPPNARNTIGDVGEETRPVVRMLESIGFRYAEEVDPFDGGPHYKAKTDEIKPIKKLFTGTLSTSHQTPPSPEMCKKMLVKSESSAVPFQAFCVDASIDQQRKKIFIKKNDFQLEEGQSAAVIPL